jgi:hypothetical protein
MINLVFTFVYWPFAWGLYSLCCVEISYRIYLSLFLIRWEQVHCPSVEKSSVLVLACWILQSEITIWDNNQAGLDFIMEVVGSNHGWYTDYIDRYVMVFLSSPRQIPGLHLRPWPLSLKSWWMDGWMNEWMHKGWTQLSGPCTATFNDLLCFPF